MIVNSSLIDNNPLFNSLAFIPNMVEMKINGSCEDGQYCCIYVNAN